MVFTSEIRLRNVRRQELGAVLWALTLGAPGKDRRHRLGRGKAFGAGEVRVHLRGLSVRPYAGDGRDRVDASEDAAINRAAQTLIGEFAQHMTKSVPNWPNSPTIRALTDFADPNKGRARMNRPSTNGQTLTALDYLTRDGLIPHGHDQGKDGTGRDGHQAQSVLKKRLTDQINEQDLQAVPASSANDLAPRIASKTMQDWLGKWVEDCEDPDLAGEVIEVTRDKLFVQCEDGDFIYLHPDRVKVGVKPARE